MLLKTKDGLLKTEDVLLKIKDVLLKTEDNRKMYSWKLDGLLKP